MGVVRDREVRDGDVNFVYAYVAVSRAFAQDRTTYLRFDLQINWTGTLCNMHRMARNALARDRTVKTDDGLRELLDG
jgi:hypothetical protein